MQIVKEKLEIDEVLEKKVYNLIKFNNIKGKLENGYIISLTNTNIAYIQPHSLEIKFFFNESEDVYINDLSRSIPLKELEHFIKCTF